MPVTETSREAYEKVKPGLGPRQRTVFEALRRLGIATDKQIAAHLGFPINMVTGRRGELVTKGYVKLYKVIRDPMTRAQSFAWCCVDPNDAKAAAAIKAKPDKVVPGEAVRWADD